MLIINDRVRHKIWVKDDRSWVQNTKILAPKLPWNSFLRDWEVRHSTYSAKALILGKLVLLASEICYPFSPQPRALAHLNTESNLHYLSWCISLRARNPVKNSNRTKTSLLLLTVIKKCYWLFPTLQPIQQISLPRYYSWNSTTLMQHKNHWNWASNTATSY